jgi:hypothetical protein
MNFGNIIFRVHALQRMFERKISEKNIRLALEAGDIIEDNSGEMLEPGKLILGYQGRRPFHLVTSENRELDEVTIITVYIPDPNQWNKDYRTRRP